MNAAVEILPEEGSPGYAQQRERKMYGLKAVKLLIGDWYERLRTGREAEAKWHFRPEDLERLKADAKHPDPEIRMEAMMVHEVLMKLLPLLERGEDERGRKISETIERYLNPRPEHGTEGILKRFLGETAPRTEVARISAPPGKKRLFNGIEDAKDVTPISLDAEDAATPVSLEERGQALEVARMLERIRARRGVDKLPGEKRIEEEAEKAKRMREKLGGKGGA
jgi:hypothetical protein